MSEDPQTSLFKVENADTKAKLIQALKDIYCTNIDTNTKPGLVHQAFNTTLQSHMSEAGLQELILVDVCNGIDDFLSRNCKSIDFIHSNRGFIMNINKIYL